MMIRRSLLLGSLSLALLACARDPVGSVRAVDDRPKIAVKGAPSGSRLLVNGVDVGEANAFRPERSVLRVDRGQHQIVVVADGNVLHQETIFLGDELLKIIAVPPRGVN